MYATRTRAFATKMEVSANIVGSRLKFDPIKNVVASIQKWASPSGKSAIDDHKPTSVHVCDNSGKCGQKQTLGQ